MKKIYFHFVGLIILIGLGAPAIEIHGAQPYVPPHSKKHQPKTQSPPQSPAQPVAQPVIAPVISQPQEKSFDTLLQTVLPDHSVPLPPVSVIGPPPLPGTKDTMNKARKHTIIVDAGHGGEDPGAIGLSGVYEKNITLNAAKRLKKKLEDTNRYYVILTRDGDYFLKLRDRIAVARKNKADLFISLHADKIENPRTRGLSVYTLSDTASDKEAESLAHNENKSDIIDGLDLSGETQEVTNILIDLIQRETMNLSAQFAKRVMHELGQVTVLLQKTHRFAGFAVLKAPDVPSILIEMGYLSNKEDEAFITNVKKRDQLLDALVKAIDTYFLYDHPKEQ